MIKEQAVIAFMGKLIDRGIDPDTIERAVDEVLDIKPGTSITGNNMLIRAFCMEQSARLLKGK